MFTAGKVSSEEWDSHFDFMGPLEGPVYRIGGYAHEIQGNVSLEAQYVSHGFYCGDSSGYDKGRKAGLEPGADDWRLLLQVDSEERTGMDWGDGGRIYFMIHKDAIRQREFEKVWLILQCT